MRDNRVPASQSKPARALVQRLLLQGWWHAHSFCR